MGKVYCSLSVDLDNCPKCGNPLAEAEYFLAKKDTKITKVDMNYGTGKKTTHFTNQYSEIERNVGSICLNCCRKQEKPKRIISLTMLLSGIIGIIVLSIVDEFYLKKESILFYFMGITAIWLGWQIFKTCNFVPTEEDAVKGEELDQLSRLFVNKVVNNRDFPADKVVLSRNFFDN